MVHTRDGSVYYGELVERVTGDHVTIMNASGEVKRFAMKDVDPNPAPDAPLYRPPEPEPPPTGTVRTKDGSIFYGEILEKVARDHVLIRLASGETRTLDWDDLDTSTPPPAHSPPRPPGPTETVRTKKGNVYHGDLIEKVVGNHETVALVTGELVTIAWSDIDVRTRPAIAKHDHLLDFRANRDATLERRLDVGWQKVCTAPCEDVVPTTGIFRANGPDSMPTRPFRLSSTNDDHVVARLASALSAVPAGLVGNGLTLAALGANPWQDNMVLDTINVVVNVGAFALLAAGVTILSLCTSSVHVNGETVAPALLHPVRF